MCPLSRPLVIPDIVLPHRRSAKQQGLKGDLPSSAEKCGTSSKGTNRCPIRRLAMAQNVGDGRCGQHVLRETDCSDVGLTGCRTSAGIREGIR